MIRIINKFFLAAVFLSAILVAEETDHVFPEFERAIDFNEVDMVEFLRFVSKISNANFIYDQDDLDFKITFTSGTSSTPAAILDALVALLKAHGFSTKKQDNYYIIRKCEPRELGEPKFSQDLQFFSYKLQYHQGGEIEEALKKMNGNITGETVEQKKLLKAIHSLQWVKSTNSLFYSSDEPTAKQLNGIIESLDIPLRQVFIEVLVIETDVKNTLDFGLQWAVGGSFPGLGFGVGNFPHPGTPFANTMKGMSNTSPQGLSQIPIGRGFDLGVIGDIITHKGKAFFSLGALVSALQADGSSTVVLNQKIITQDNKNSKIFSGDNIPFTGSVVQTVGQGQQTSANIEYRDVGVSLSITPVLGEGKIITLDIVEEITEAAHEDVSRLSSATVGGIRTSKTNMATQAHVPDNHFLVISGMIRNAKTKEKTGIPCLGGLPIIGAAFSRTIDHNEKKNIIIFVRPRIINSVDDYREITAAQENLFKSQTHLDEFEDGIQLLQQ